MVQSFGPVKNGQEKNLYMQAMTEAIKVFPLPEEDQKRILNKYGWDLSMQILLHSRELKESSRIAKTHRRALNDYLHALDSALAGKKITLTHWKRAGEVMEHVFQQDRSR